MDIVVYVLLAVIAVLGAGLVALMLRRNDAHGQIVLADTVQRIQESLRDQERALASIVSDRLGSTRRRRRSASSRPRSSACSTSSPTSRRAAPLARCS
jgi:hypothetical protein